MMYKKIVIFLFLHPSLYSMDYLTDEVIQEIYLKDINVPGPQGNTVLHAKIDLSSELAELNSEKPTPATRKLVKEVLDRKRAFETAIFLLNGARAAQNDDGLTFLDIAQAYKAHFPLVHEVAALGAENNTAQVRNFLKKPPLQSHARTILGKDITDDMPPLTLFRLMIVKCQQTKYAKYQAHIDEKDNKGNTLLHKTINIAPLIVMKALQRSETIYSPEVDMQNCVKAAVHLLNGANPTVRNKRGATPFDFATMAKNYTPYVYEVVKLGAEGNRPGIRNFLKKPDVLAYTQKVMGKDMSDASAEEMFFWLSVTLDLTLCTNVPTH